MMNNDDEQKKREQKLISFHLPSVPLLQDIDTCINLAATSRSNLYFNLAERAIIFSSSHYRWLAVETFGFYIVIVKVVVVNHVKLPSLFYIIVYGFSSSLINHIVSNSTTSMCLNLMRLQ